MHIFPFVMRRHWQRVRLYGVKKCLIASVRILYAEWRASKLHPLVYGEEPPLTLRIAETGPTSKAVRTFSFRCRAAVVFACESLLAFKRKRCPIARIFLLRYESNDS